MQDTETLLCTALRGSLPEWPKAKDSGFAERFLERCAYHGVQSLLHHVLSQEDGIAAGWPQEVLTEIRQQATEWTMWELRHQDLVMQLLERLAGRDIEALLFKGTALAYDLYSRPVLRSRGDTDLLVEASERVRVEEVLESLGFVRDPGLRGSLLSYQASYTFVEQNGSIHSVDLHWRVNDSPVLAELFTYEDLHARAEPLPQLSPHALKICSVDGLLLACLHRSKHKQTPYFVDGVAHYSGDRLIWLYDLHLLAQSLTQDQWAEFLALASQKGLRALCLEGLLIARSRYGTELDDECIEALSCGSAPEPMADYMEASPFRRLWLDVCAIDSSLDKLGFLREKILPPTDHIRNLYPDAESAWLPRLYLRRAKDWVTVHAKAKRK